MEWGNEENMQSQWAAQVAAARASIFKHPFDKSKPDWWKGNQTDDMKARASRIGYIPRDGGDKWDTEVM